MSQTATVSYKGGLTVSRGDRGWSDDSVAKSTHDTIVEDLRWAPTRQLLRVYSSSSRGSGTFRLLQAMYVNGTLTYTQANTHTHKVKHKILFKREINHYLDYKWTCNPFQCGNPETQLQSYSPKGVSSTKKGAGCHPSTSSWPSATHSVQGLCGCGVAILKLEPQQAVLSSWKPSAPTPKKGTWE